MQFFAANSCSTPKTAKRAGFVPKPERIFATVNSSTRLVVADGFHEWPTRQTPRLITLCDGEPFVFAGLWEKWKPRNGGDRVETFTILTTSPNDFHGHDS